MNSNFNTEINICGEYRLYVSENNDIVSDTGWCKNTILSSGLVALSSLEITNCFTYLDFGVSRSLSGTNGYQLTGVLELSPVPESQNIEKKITQKYTDLGMRSSFYNTSFSTSAVNIQYSINEFCIKTKDSIGFARNVLPTEMSVQPNQVVNFLYRFTVFWNMEYKNAVPFRTGDSTFYIPVTSKIYNFPANDYLYYINNKLILLKNNESLPAFGDNYPSDISFAIGERDSIISPSLISADIDHETRSMSVRTAYSDITAPVSNQIVSYDINTVLLAINGDITQKENKFHVTRFAQPLALYNYTDINNSSPLPIVNSPRFLNQYNCFTKNQLNLCYTYTWKEIDGQFVLRSTNVLPQRPLTSVDIYATLTCGDEFTYNGSKNQETGIILDLEDNLGTYELIFDVETDGNTGPARFTTTYENNYITTGFLGKKAKDIELNDFGYPDKILSSRGSIEITRTSLSARYIYIDFDTITTDTVFNVSAFCPELQVTQTNFIDENASGRNFGYVNDISGDGNVIAVGAPGYRDQESIRRVAGQVYVYRKDQNITTENVNTPVLQTKWTLLTAFDSTLQGSFNAVGEDIALNGDGKIVAVSNTDHSEPGRNFTGGVSVYRNTAGDIGSIDYEVYKYPLTTTEEKGKILVTILYGGTTPAYSEDNLARWRVSLLKDDGSIYETYTVTETRDIFDAVSEGPVRVRGAKNIFFNNLPLDFNVRVMVEDLNAGTSSISDLISLNKTNIITLRKLPQWVRHGSIITGTTVSDSFGQNVRLNSTGNILVAASNGEEFRGKISVFTFANNAWTRIGNEITGGLASFERNERWGNKTYGSIDIDAEGTRIAISTTEGYANGISCGSVIVLTYNPTTGLWEQTGQRINGNFAYSRLGHQVQLSNQGNTLFVSGNNITSQTTNTGFICVYDLISDSWVLRDTIIGSLTGQPLGNDFSASEDGEILVASLPFSEFTKDYIYKNLLTPQEKVALLYGNTDPWKPYAKALETGGGSHGMVVYNYKEGEWSLLRSIKHNNYYNGLNPIARIKIGNQCKVSSNGEDIITSSFYGFGTLYSSYGSGGGGLISYKLNYV